MSFFHAVQLNLIIQSVIDEFDKHNGNVEGILKTFGVCPSCGSTMMNDLVGNLVDGTDDRELVLLGFLVGLTAGKSAYMDFSVN